MRPLQCSVCLNPASHFHYGVSCCDACRMFFQRVHYSKHPVKECRADQKCLEKDRSVLKCRFCRFQQCVKVGMVARALKNTDHNMVARTKNKKLTVLLGELSKLNARREDSFLHTSVPEDLSIEQIIDRNEMSVEEAGPVLSSSLDCWFQEAYTTIEMMKKLDFVKFLNFEDRTLLVSKSFSGWSVFIAAMRSYSCSSDSMIFPGGVDIFPEYSMSRQCPLFRQKTKSQLVERLIELRITNDEFLLLSVTLFCNPAVADFSDTGRLLLTSYQKLYNTALFNHCIASFQQAGPSRFTDLLSLGHVINTTLHNIRSHSTFLPFYQPQLWIKTLVKEFLDLK